MKLQKKNIVVKDRTIFKASFHSDPTTHLGTEFSALGARLVAVQPLDVQLAELEVGQGRAGPPEKAVGHRVAATDSDRPDAFD